jgi:hypothetical protein
VITKKKRKKSAWKDEFYWKVYELVKEGRSLGEISKIIGVHHQSLRTWAKENPTLKKCIREAREGKTEKELPTLKDYIYKRLSPEALKLYEEIQALDQEDNGQRRIEALLADAGTKMRQHLFIHAIVSTSFNVSKAMTMLCMSKKMLDDWISNDPDFPKLVDEIEWHKGNFFEDHFIRLVRSGSEAAILHAQKTFNRSRGYGDRQTLEIEGNIRHQHELIDVNKLPKELKRELLKSLEGNESNVIDMGTVKALPAKEEEYASGE